MNGGIKNQEWSARQGGARAGAGRENSVGIKEVSFETGSKAVATDSGLVGTSTVIARVSDALQYVQSE